ncbi:MAG: glycosyltransferase [Fimbriimonadales bacterium]|jgi:glycosyltransferase involved in cell wall biosynthesis|nr:glycosyltransferase [Armatimonadota bacterium]MCX7687853.1 glycosyltransferase [Fimbriimonadales bacterium]CUU05427.1 Glycosyltransferase involved in cell wall bisynthesis [Armatimonadetes bacterium GBS]CUU33972.1 Glycosyltransferase involved in cell wall bisynthesis [Armatimonadetes bacterium GXS]GBC89900.1 Chondroitin synthase [bacterium HR14]
MPAVSVLIPSYNHAHYLPLALQSVFEQTYTDYEIVVVDDGSTDGSVALLESYGERIRLFTQQNRGTYATLNRLIAESRGQYLAILNSDDLWLPQKLEKQVAMLEANPRMGLVHTYGYFIDDAGNRLPQNPLGYPWPRTTCLNPIEDLVRYNRIVPSSAMIRRECFEKLGGFREDLYGLGDWEMWLRIALHYEIGFIDEPLTLYRVHATNACHRHDKMRMDEIKVRSEAIHAREALFWQRANSPRAMRLALAHSYACLGTNYALFEDRRNARRAYLKSLQLYPLRFKSLLRLALTFLPIKMPL